MTQPETMNTLSLSDPDRRRALVGVLIHLDEMDDATAALCRYVPGDGIDIITTKPAVACVSWFETFGSDAAAYVLAIAPEAARDADATELALDIIDAAERMDVPLCVREPGKQWATTFFAILMSRPAETPAPERGAVQLVAFRGGWEVSKSAGKDSHRKARAQFKGRLSEVYE